MNFSYNPIEIGQVFRLKKSKKNSQLVAYTDIGKVILIKNQADLHYGFAKVTSFVDKGKFYLATMENVPYDFYYGYEDDEVIPYAELCEVLKMKGFTHEYQTAIDEDNFFDVWANLDTGAMVQIETWNWDGQKTYNTVNVYIPTGNSLAFIAHDRMGFSHGGYNICCFNIVHTMSDFPLQYVLNCCSNSKNWNGEHPSLWHYGDKSHNMNFAKILTRIYDFKDDIGSIFNMDIEGAFKRYAENGIVA